jgi:hypothetical protein
MLRQILAVAALAGFLGTAQAGSILEAGQYSAEVPLAELDVPSAQGGTLKFAVCDGCEAQRVIMPSSTTYLVNNRSVPFEDFVAAVATAKASTEIANRSLVGLFFDASSKGLKRIALVAPIPR